MTQITALRVMGNCACNCNTSYNKRSAAYPCVSGSYLTDTSLKIRTKSVIHYRYTLILPQLMSIIIVNIFMNSMKIYMKHFVVGNLNLCHVRTNIREKYWNRII